MSSSSSNRRRFIDLSPNIRSAYSGSNKKRKSGTIHSSSSWVRPGALGQHVARLGLQMRPTPILDRVIRPIRQSRMPRHISPGSIHDIALYSSLQPMTQYEQEQLLRRGRVSPHTRYYLHDAHRALIDNLQNPYVADIVLASLNPDAAFYPNSRYAALQIRRKPKSKSRGKGKRKHA